ncbi:hypothetical protein F2P81_018139 [Scophthalmus maximus]|uniref:Triokinase/FMN cyclase n=1 Tax=Scophthalmus maximus TaxID=52904 RepID=A0A6A4SDQ7_SCOMX|nr:hypothetical protein F2P81_018139 [Scophthalmus maximus]
MCLQGSRSERGLTGANGSYVGAGMLSAAVAGGVFASPPPASILAAILSLHNAGACGVLLIVKNYTGDRLNFGLAAEQARNCGVAVDVVIVAEDCAFDRPGKAGRRGLCGTVFVHKLAGAMAEEGSSLDQIVAKVTEVLKGTGTLGVSLSPCSVPGCLPSFDLPPGDMELGLENRGVLVARVMSGSFMTSLEMAGVSLTLMLANEETLRLFGPLSPVMREVLQMVCSTLLEKQEELNSLDRAAGDGDCGNTHAQAARAIQEWLQGHVVPGCPGRLLSVLAGLVQEKMGGSSGALYSLFLTAAAAHVTEGRSNAAAWAGAMHAGTQAMRRYGGAEPGDRTMLDALCPAADELTKLTTAPPGGQMLILQAAVQRATSGAESTRDLTARAGRASYIAAERLTRPDPGAVAVAAILRAVLESMERQKK